MMRIFLTGGTGALGTRVVPRLRAAGHEVTAVSRRPDSDQALRAAGAAPLRVDLFDAEAVRLAVSGHDAIVHLATAIPTGAAALRSRSWEATARLRREASALLVDAAQAAGTTRYVQESLAFAYEDRGDAWLDEDTPLDPHPLQASILAAEASSRRFASDGGAGVVLRFGVFYGARSAHTRAELSAARRGWAIRPGPPGAYTPALHLDDAATAVGAALEVETGVYNVVDDKPLTRAEHAAALAAALDMTRLRLPPKALGAVGNLRALARSQRVSNTKLRTAGWQPGYPSAREGWAQIVAAPISPGTDA